MDDEAVAQRERPVDQGHGLMPAAQRLGVEDERPAVAEAQLVEAGSFPHAHGKTARRDLGPERPGVALRHGVERVGPVDDQAGENVEPSGRALGIGRPGDAGRQREALHQRRDIDDALLQDRAIALKRHLFRVQALQPFEDARPPPRQEARADAIGLAAEAEVEARRLQLGRFDRRGRRNRAGVDKRQDPLARQQARRAGKRRRRGLVFAGHPSRPYRELALTESRRRRLRRRPGPSNRIPSGEERLGKECLAQGKPGASQAAHCLLV